MSKAIIKDDSFIFEYDDKRIEFSNPSIQPFNEDKNKISGKDIMYYYYTLTLYDKVENYDDNDYDKEPEIEWKVITEVFASDAPAIRIVQKYINEILKFNVKENGFNIKLSDKDNEHQEWKYTWNIDGWFFKEDEYVITKTKRRVWQLKRYNEVYWYDMYIGCGGYAKHNTIGINLMMLNQKDLKIFKYVIDQFIKYSIDQYNLTR